MLTPRKADEAQVGFKLLRGRGLIYSVAGAVLAGLLLLSGVTLWQVRNGIFEDARSRSATLAYLLAEQTTRTFQAVDLTLIGLEPLLAPTPRDRSVAQLLRRRVDELDFIRSIDVTSADGRIVETSRSGGEAPTSLASHAYFEMLKRNPGSGMVVGRSKHSLTTGTIPVARRLVDADGGFAGVIVANVEPRYFRDFYRNLDLGRHASIDLFQDNGGVLLASSGDDAAPFRSGGTLASPPFDLSMQLGQFRSAPSEKGQQLISYHRAQGYPLVVAVAVDVSDLYARWLRISVPVLSACAVAALLTLLLAAIVDRRLAERRRAQARAMTVQKLEALGQMTASVAHDFRNLLTVMESTLVLLRKRGPTERLLAAAEEAVERGGGLITQLLAFSRRQEWQVQPADLNAMLHGLEGMLRHVAGGGVRIVVAPGEGLPLCRADRTQFDAALMNLVVNARQAMPNGGTVRLSTGVADGGADARFVELGVSDEGCGIAPGDLKRVFEPFFTTKAETGTGLGLSQVYGFMRQIGGDVRVTSRVGTGTTFTLLFPVAEADAGAPRPTDDTAALLTPAGR